MYNRQKDRKSWENISIHAAIKCGKYVGAGNDNDNDNETALSRQNGRKGCGIHAVCRRVQTMKKAYSKYFLALLFFSSNGVVASFIGLSSYEIVFFRSLLGSLMLISIFFFTGHKLTIFQQKKDLIFIALSGVAMAADWLFLFEAYAHIGVSLGMVMNYSGPAIMVAFSPLIFKERVTWQKLTALIVALIGVALISGQAALGGLSTWGLLCGILSALSYAAMVIFNKLSKQITGLENSMLQLFFTFLTVAIFVGCKQGFYIGITPNDWLPILWIGLLNTGASCYLYFSAIGTLPVQTVAICGYLEPVSAVLLAVVFLHETMNPLQMLGSALIIYGALLGEGVFQKKKAL